MVRKFFCHFRVNWMSEELLSSSVFMRPAFRGLEAHRHSVRRWMQQLLRLSGKYVRAVRSSGPLKVVGSAVPKHAQEPNPGLRETDCVSPWGAYQCRGDVNMPASR